MTLSQQNHYKEPPTMQKYIVLEIEIGSKIPFYKQNRTDVAVEVEENKLDLFLVADPFFAWVASHSSLPFKKTTFYFFS
jgi:hypothetical protein